MARTTLTRRGAAIGAASLVTLLLGMNRASAESFVEVSRHGSKYSVDATGASVTSVLLALGREAGFGVEDARPDLDRTISLVVDDATLEQTLRRVLEQQNHLILYRKGVTDLAAPDAVARVVLLGMRADRSGGVPGGTPQNGPASPLAGPGGTAPPVPAVPDAQQVAPAVAAAASAAAAAAIANGNVPGTDPSAAMDAAAALGVDPGMVNALPQGAESIALRHAQALEAAGAITEQTIYDRLPGELEDPILPDPEADVGQ